MCGNYFCLKVGCKSFPVKDADRVAEKPQRILYSFEEYFAHGSINMNDGRYLQHIQRWLQFINQDQLFITQLGDLAEKTTEVTKALAKFLGLQQDWGDHVVFPSVSFEHVEVDISCKTFSALESYYAEANEGLANFINSHRSPYQPYFEPLVANRNVCN